MPVYFFSAFFTARVIDARRNRRTRLYGSNNQLEFIRKTTDGRSTRTKLLWLFLFFTVPIKILLAEPINTICPVTTDKVADPAITATYQGQTIAFCSKLCFQKFNANPEAYLSAISEVKSVDQKENGQGIEDVVERAGVEETTHDHSHGQVGGHEEHVELEPRERGDNPALEDDDEHDHATGHTDASAASAWQRLLAYLARVPQLG